MKRIVCFVLSAVLIISGIQISDISEVKAAEVSYKSVPVGEKWCDTSGNVIQAHGGGFLQENGKYYWVGENKSHNSGDFLAVSLYSSTDLLNWKKEGDILTENSVTVAGAENGLKHCKVERPKLVKNSDGIYVLFGHWEDTTNYSSSQIMVATSKDIAGPYIFQGHWRPGAKKEKKYRNWRNVKDIGYITDTAYFADKASDITEEEVNNTDNYGFGSRDLTVYTEGNTGYLISAEDHSKMRIHQLNETFDDVKTIAEGGISYNIFEGAKREAPALVKAENGYYIIMSGQSGWFPNQSLYAYTEDISNPEGWSDLKVIGNNSTFYSQPTNIITISKKNGKNQYVYMGDRWNSSELGASTYVWLPLEIDTVAHTMNMEYCLGWKLNTTSGEIELPNEINVSENKPVIAEKGKDGVDKSGDTEVTYELKPEYANDGKYDMADYWSNEKKLYYGQSKVPYTWTVDLEKAYDLSRVDISYLTVGGSEGMYGYYIKGSNDNQNWETLRYNGGNRQVAFTSDKVNGKYRYIQVEIVSIVNIRNGSSVAGWANGLMEVQVFAKNQTAEITELPQINLNSGKYVGKQNVYISSESGSKIYYTLNGLEPNENSNVYSGNLEIPVGTYTLKAVSYKDGKECSPIAQREYTIYDPEAIDYSKTNLEGCVHIGDTSASLPTDFTLMTYGGTSKRVQVKWNSKSFEQSDMFHNVYVEGKIVGEESKSVIYTVMVLPSVNEYFITCNNTSSELWNRVKAITPTMLNQVPDQRRETSTQTWGYVKRGNVKSKTTNQEPWNTGYYNDGGSVEYVLKLGAGKHEVNIGIAGWWGNTYNLDVKYSYEGKSETSLCNVQVKGNDEGYGMGMIELAKETEVTIKVPKVLAWISVGKPNQESQPGISETTSFSNDKTSEMKETIVTNNQWIDLGVWQYLFNSWNGSKGMISGGDQKDNLKVKIVSSNWQEWGTQVKCSVNTVPGQTYRYKIKMNASKGDGSYYFIIGEQKQFLQLLKGENVIAGTYTATSSKTDINFMIAYVGLNVELEFNQMQFLTEAGEEVTFEHREIKQEEPTTPKLEESTTPKPEESTTPKPEESTTPKPEEPTTPEQIETKIGLGLTAQTYKVSTQEYVNNVMLQWERTEGVTEYRLYRAKNKTDLLELNDNVREIYKTSVATTYEDTNLANEDMIYYYQVIGYTNEQVTSKTVITEGKTYTKLPNNMKSYDGASGGGPSLNKGICIDGKYYSYSLKGSASGTNRCIEKISKDNANWANHGVVLDSSDDDSLKDCKFESISTIYNEKTKKVVIWAHYELASGYSTGALVCISGTPGDLDSFTYSGLIFPNGLQARDKGVFIDDDGTGYLVTASNEKGESANETIYIHKLKEDWASVDETNGYVAKLFEKQYREAPTLIKVDGMYYLFTSKASGWLPSEGMYASAKNLYGEWSELKTLGNAASFGGQQNGVSNIVGTECVNQGFVYASRWWRTDGSPSRVVTPVMFCSGFATTEYFNKVYYNTTTGVVIGERTGEILSLGKPTQFNGMDAPETVDGDYKTKSVVTKEWPAIWQVDLEKEYELSEIQISWYLIAGSEAHYPYKVYGRNTDDEEWTILVDDSNETLANNKCDYGFTTDKLKGKYRYIRLEIIKSRPQNGQNNNWYTPQLWEVKVLGNTEAVPPVDDKEEENTTINTTIEEMTTKTSEIKVPTIEMVMQKNSGLPVGYAEESRKSKFSILFAKVKKGSKTSNKISWKKLKSADGYIVFGAKCNQKGKRYKFHVLKITDKNSICSYTHNKLKKGSYYKYLVQAYKMEKGKMKILTTSKTIHSATRGGKAANVKSIRVNKSKIHLKKKGRAFKIKAAVKKNGKVLKKHRKVLFESSNTNIVTVSRNGLIKAKKRGTCYVYAYAQNGVYKRITVIVRK